MTLFLQQDLSSYDSGVRHSTRCHWIRIHAEQRSKDARGEIVRLLRELEEPMDVSTCRAIADFFDPNIRRKRGPKISASDELRKCFEAAECYGELLACIGDDDGPVDEADARFSAIEKLGISERTFDGRVAGPFRRVVQWAKERRDPDNVTDEENAAVRIEFYEQFKQRHKGRND